jgi:hypothetical protein
VLNATRSSPFNAATGRAALDQDRSHTQSVPATMILQASRRLVWTAVSVKGSKVIQTPVDVGLQLTASVGLPIDGDAIAIGIANGKGCAGLVGRVVTRRIFYLGPSFRFTHTFGNALCRRTFSISTGPASLGYWALR